MVTTNERGHVEVRCDGCLSAPASALGIRTWPARSDAIAELIGPAHGWAWVDGRLRCARCARAAACDVTSHSFGNWTPNDAGTLAERTCTVCNTQEHAPRYVASSGHSAA